MPDADATPTPAMPDTPRKAPIGSLRALWPFVRRHKGLFAGWLLALGVSSTASLSLPVAFRTMIDHGFSHGSAGGIDRAFGLLFAVALVLAIGTATRFFFVSLLGERVVADLRRQLYAHLIGLDADFHDRNRSGELVSRLTADVELIRNIVGSVMSIALRSSITAIGALVMLFVTSPKLAAWALVGIPAAVAPVILGSRIIRRIARHSQDRVADANALAAETLGAVRTVQAHAREDYERGRFVNAVANAVGTARKRIGAQAVMTGSTILLFFGAITLVLWSGAHDVLAHRLTAGTLIQFVLYALFAGGSVAALAEVFNELQRAAGGMSRIDELLQETPGIVAPKHPRRLPDPLHGEVALEAVDFRYPTRPEAPALKDFTLHVRPGETVALVGPSGAGKTTLINLLPRFIEPTAGTLRLDGIALADWDVHALRRQFALVSQDVVLFNDSIAANVALGQTLDRERVRAALAGANLLEHVDTLPQGIDTEIGHNGSRLSGGQRQRLAIARAIYKDAPILILDEATSALDSESERLVQDALERLMQGRTSIVIAHRLSTIERADRIVALDGGRVVEQGTHAALLAAGGLYARLHALQFRSPA